MGAIVSLCKPAALVSMSVLHVRPAAIYHLVCVAYLHTAHTFCKIATAVKI